MADEPRATTATVVFTDMVGSTVLRSRLGEERADELRRIHDSLLSARIEAHRGRVLKGKGDGLVAAFAAASDAVAASIEMQQAIAAYNRRRDALADVSIRIGLSTGDVSWEGGDCFGAPLVEAARLEAVAAGGQILCSEFVRMMARGRGGHEFRPIGFLELKGLPEPLAANEVVWVAGPDPGALPLPPELTGELSRPFVGRKTELDAVEDLFAGRSNQRLAVLWLLGEPGIGKTRLAGELARRARAAGDVVLFGRCNEDLAVPYQPFVEALRWFVARVPPAQLDGRLGELPGELTRILPELSALRPDLEPARSASPELEQHQLFEAVRSWLASAGDGRPVVAVLDDLHWAARPTLALLGHVARSAEPSPTLLVCTARNTAPDDNEALAALVEDLERRGVPSRRAELAGVDIQDVGELVARAAGRPLDDGLRALAGRLHQETAGNPLFVDALLSGLPDDGSAYPDTLPRTLAETVSRRVARLDQGVADFLRVASVAGLDFDLRVAAVAAGCEDLAAVDACEAAAGAGLVNEAGPDRYCFTHGLVRATLRDELSRSRRVRIHLRVGEALEQVFTDRLHEHLPNLAYQFFEAAPAGGALKALRYAVLAAEQSAHQLAYAEAADAYGRALDLLETVPPEGRPARAELLLARGEAENRAGNKGPALEMLRAAAEAGPSPGGTEVLARAAIAYEQTGFSFGSQGPGAVALLERAEVVLPGEDSPLLALVLASTSRALEFTGRRTEGMERGRTALAMAERLADPHTTAQVLLRTTFAYAGVEGAPEMAARCPRLLRLARETDDDELEVWALGFSLFAAAELGDFVAFDEVLADLAPMVEQLRQPVLLHAVALWRHLQAMLAADLTRAEQLVTEASRLSQGYAWDFDGVYAVMMFLVRREQGALDDAVPMVKMAVRLNPEASLWRPGLAALYAELGMRDEARVEFEALARDEFAAVPDDGNRLMLLCLLAEVCCAVGDPEHATDLLEKLRPCEGRMLVFFSPVCLGPADRLLGMLASVAGRANDAERWLARALELSRRGSPLWTAHCLYDYAVHLPPTDAGRAAALLEEAARLCQRHGLVGLGRRVAAALE